MPARPLAPETLHLIDAVRTALQDQVDVVEKTMFGCHIFMVNGKMCLGVENDELLVRLPPAEHAVLAETPGLRPLSPKGMHGYFFIAPAAYATRTQWQRWITAALAFNPLARATPSRKKPKPTGSAVQALPEGDCATPEQPPKRHSVFESDL